ncbi:MAG: lipoprotein, RlpA family [bacterium]|nr:MAG: lipoprotein, RlpA family [bacterium]
MLFLLAGCVGSPVSSVFRHHRKYTVTPPAGYYYDGYQERGIASWYGSDFDGKPTASGEIYNMYASTAANKTLPLGTVVRVKNLNNGKTTVVRINDRGPFVKGRIIDLSYKAAKDIGIVRTGTAPVVITIIGGNYGKVERFTLQVGAFVVRSNAVRLKDRLDPSFYSLSIRKVRQSGLLLYKVFVGDFATPAQSNATRKILLNLGFSSFLTVK